MPSCPKIQRWQKNTNLQAAFSPRQGAMALIIKIIGEAKESIHVAAYSFTSRPIAEALAAAHDKGVDVEIVLDKSQRKGRGTLVPFLHDHHIPTRINSHYAIMHNKFNYTKAAEEKNAENVLIVRRNTKIIHDYQKQ